MRKAVHQLEVSGFSTSTESKPRCRESVVESVLNALVSELCSLEWTPPTPFEFATEKAEKGISSARFTDTENANLLIGLLLDHGR